MIKGLGLLAVVLCLLTVSGGHGAIRPTEPFETIRWVEVPSTDCLRTVVRESFAPYRVVLEYYEFPHPLYPCDAQNRYRQVVYR